MAAPRRHRAHPPAGGAISVAAALLALCFAFVLGDGSMIAALGYLIAMMTGAVVLGVFGLVTGGLAALADAFAAYSGGLLADSEGYFPRMAWTLGWLTASACWVPRADGVAVRPSPLPSARCRTACAD